ncbi:hypothetical protein RD792_017645 [Penstemon davidsonii]|uniref:Uncharacterized protein n=1 Tax=Penstemon davidsonii TaxID=160366 RepID=A0ABR0CN61_9LAMI|nr:hypothetical protein RD792_017645 [Penstemon davidsonii]
MFFSGDSSTRKRVDLGGRSSKERDRKKLLEQARLERNQRLWLRQQNTAALNIQECELEGTGTGTGTGCNVYKESEFAKAAAF